MNAKIMERITTKSRRKADGVDEDNAMLGARSQLVRQFSFSILTTYL